MSRRLTRMVAAAASVACLTSCASLRVDSIPQPGNSYDDGYDVTMKFESVLNLPEHAKVVLDGVTVGMVSKVTLAENDVDVTARVARGVAIPSDTRAVLQQATVLGDIYVALERPPGDGPQVPALSSGGVVPISQTTSPPQLEDTIASLANFVSSGSIQRAQNTIIRLNRVVSSSAEVRELTATVETNLAALSNNIDDVDRLLDGAFRTGEVIDGHIPHLQLWFSPNGQTAFRRQVAITNFIGSFLPTVGSISLGGYWLLPFLKSLRDAVGAVQQSKVNVEEEIPAYRRLFNDYFLPADKYPAINITSIIGPDGQEMSGNVQDVLRILGAVP